MGNRFVCPKISQAPDPGKQFTKESLEEEERMLRVNFLVLKTLCQFCNCTAGVGDVMSGKWLNGREPV